MGGGNRENFQKKKICKIAHTHDGRSENNQFATKNGR